MTAILVVGNSDGERRCDAHCHEAREPECTCICGGRYHGAGSRALELVQRDLVDHVELGRILDAVSIQASLPIGG